MEVPNVRIVSSAMVHPMKDEQTAITRQVGEKLYILSTVPLSTISRVFLCTEFLFGKVYNSSNYCPFILMQITEILDFATQIVAFQFSW